MDKNQLVKNLFDKYLWITISDFFIVNLISSGSYFVPGFLPGDLQNRNLQIPRLEKGLELKGETPQANDPAIKVS